MSPETFDRTQVRAWIEEATNGGLSVLDALPETLIARAEEMGLTPRELRLWIYDQPKFDERGDWSGDALARYIEKVRASEAAAAAEAEAAIG